MASDLVPRSSLGEEYVRMDGVMMKASYQEVINRIQRMEVRLVSSNPPKILSQVSKEDVWLVSYPRSGTTWVQELVSPIYLHHLPSLKYICCHRCGMW